jgi:hypothetical protein
VKTALAVAALGVGLLSGSGAVASPPAHADSGCDSIFWGMAGTQIRQICDGPIEFDGSWLRQRIIGRPALVSPASTQCYGSSFGLYYSWSVQNCQTTPSRYFPESDESNDTYRVWPDAIPPGEPGHLN